jgi:MtrB/PioB family decaheme-associated outer membrane protein
MRRHTCIIVALLAAAAPAQAQPSPVTVTGSIGAGGRQVDNDTNSSKLTEYRDLDDDAFVPRLTLNVFRVGGGGFFDFSGANVSRTDQTFSARGGRAGRWSFGFDWFDIPHNLSNKAQTPYIARGRGLLEVPATVPITFKKLNTAAADAPGVLASDQLIASYQAGFLRPTALATRSNLGRITTEYAALEALKLGVTYDLRKKSGLQPAFGPIGDRPPRTLNIQLTEPVDYRTQDVTLSAEHVGRKYKAQFSYLFSDFSNRIDTLVWENIYATAPPDSTFDVWDRAVSVFGRRPLAPDNRYHNLSLSIARELPAESRLSATVALGLLDQNARLLPYSFHSNALANPTLPRETAQASMRTTQALVDYTIHPAPRLNVKAWARFYGLDNDTREAPWQYVTSDTSNLNGTVSYKNKRLNLAYASNRTNAGIDATYRVRPWRSSLTLGYEREWITRQYREADTAEDRVTASLRARPARWANLRAQYKFGARDGTYDPFVTRRSYWYESSEANDADNPRFTFSNHPDMRRYDDSDRRQNQADFTLTLTPGEALSLAASVRYRSDDFESGVTPSRPLAGTGFAEQNAVSPGAQLGLLKDKRLSYTLDVDYTASERVSVNAFLSLDRGTSSQRSLEYNENNKMNPSGVATAELGPWTRAGSQWTADFDDRAWTAGIGTTLGLVPKRVDLSATYTLSLGNFDLAYAGYGVVNFDGTPFPPNHQFAFPSRPPRINQDLHVFDLRLEFPVVTNVSFLVGYSYERYRTDDWQQGQSFPWVEPVGSEFLLRDTSRSHQWGNRLFNLGTFLAPRYNAHIGWVAFSYRF